MRTSNMHEAKTHRSRFVDEAGQGGNRSSSPRRGIREGMRRLGFSKGLYTVPNDIKTPFAKEIEETFYGERSVSFWTRNWSSGRQSQKPGSQGRRGRS